MNKRLISIIIPCYNEEANIQRTYAEVKKNLLPEYDYEIVFIDNCSTDRSAEIMRSLVIKNPLVKAILLSRNFGPEASGLAGLHHARGEAMIIIACDLQDPPELIPQFIQKWLEGYEIVLGQTIGTADNWFMRKLRQSFYRILHNLSYIDIPQGVTGFGLIDKKVNDALKTLPEKNRFYRGLLAWAGFRRYLLPYQRRERHYGTSSYNLFTYLKHAESGLFSFTHLPLDFLAYLGVFFVLAALIIMLAFVITYFVYGNPITGSASLFLGIMFFGGIQVLAISILGKYISIIFDETKNRPHYVVKEILE